MLSPQSHDCASVFAAGLAYDVARLEGLFSAATLSDAEVVLSASRAVERAFSLLRAVRPDIPEAQQLLKANWLLFRRLDKAVIGRERSPADFKHHLADIRARARTVGSLVRSNADNPLLPTRVEEFFTAVALLLQSTTDSGAITIEPGTVKAAFILLDQAWGRKRANDEN
jgi:hypothetical protein